MKTYYRWRWWTVALRGLVAVLFGIVALFAPQLAFLTLVILFGAYAVIAGGLTLALASDSMRFTRGPMIAHGVVSIIAGAIALVLPGITAWALLLVIGLWAIVSGILEIATAIRLRAEIEHEWMLGLEGVLSVAFGVLLLLAPFAGAVVLGLWVGAYALVLGGMLISTGFRMRAHTFEPPTTAAA